MSNNTKLLCLFLRAQKINKSSEQGYAMAMVSMVSIIMLSLLAASMTFSNLAKSRTDAFVDSYSAFSVAESGLNKRAIDLQTKLATYSGLKTISTSGNLSSCFGIPIPAGQKESTSSGINDFECRNYSFKSRNNASTVISQGNISLNNFKEDEAQNTYIAYTFVADKTKLGADGRPSYSPILTGEPFAGLNAVEYNYEVQSTASKPVNSQGAVTSVVTPTVAEAAARAKLPAARIPAEDALVAAYDAKQAAANVAATETARVKNSSTSTNLSVNFLTRVIPLFQFGIFYDGDMELNSTSPMELKGRVHSNANIYVQPAGIGGTFNNRSITTFLSNVSAVESIYNRVDAYTVDGAPLDASNTGITRVLLTGASCDATAATPLNCQDVTGYVSSFVTPLVLSSITAPSTARVNLFPDSKVLDGLSGAVSLKTPAPGFTRKRNYADNKIGMYYSQADMRLEMVPDRSSTNDPKVIPFNFTAITTGGSGACTTALPTAGSDPAANYIDPTRENASTRRCKVFTKGQLQSLRQPVVVLTSINQNNFNGTFTNAQWRAWEGTVLGAPASLPTLDSPLSTSANNLATKRKIVRALQVALASTPTPIRFERLDEKIDNFSNLAYGSENLIDFKTGFSNLIELIPELTGSAAGLTGDKAILIKSTPKQIAALVDAWFLPAPIQRVTRPVQDSVPAEAAKNPRQSGFYDRRERRWITMLQTNIASLSVWNRDGLYVDSTNPTDLRIAYAPTATGAVDAFNSGTGANFTDGMAFDRSAADATKPITSLQYMGLGASDITEGGLVFHATVSDDLNGNGGALSATEDITVDKNDLSQRILKKKADNTNELDRDGNVILLDYYRKYPGQTASKQSPFAFAFNGGDYLPGALLLSSDQSVYIQGNFNNQGATQPAFGRNTPNNDRLPASVIADTITALSNDCVSLTGVGANSIGVPRGQLKCGVPMVVGNSPTTTSEITYDVVATPMAINAAFLSNTPISNGNKGTGRDNGGAKSYSGGVNNYIRLLEDWNNNEDDTRQPFALNYTGSLISLGAPLEYSGQFVAGGSAPSEFPYYNVPFRNINFDDKFTKVELLPPLTPKATYIKQKNFSRSY